MPLKPWTHASKTGNGCPILAALFSAKVGISTLVHPLCTLPVQILVKPPNVPDFPQLKHSQAEIKSMFLPVYPIQLDKMDIEAEIKKRSLRAALFVS